MKFLVLLFSLSMSFIAFASDFLQPSQQQINSIQDELSTCDSLFFTQQTKDCLLGQIACPADTTDLIQKSRTCYMNTSNNIVEAFYPEYTSISQDLDDLIQQYEYQFSSADTPSLSKIDYTQESVFQAYKQYKITEFIAQNVKIMPLILEKILLVQNKFHDKKKYPFVNPLFHLTLDPYSTMTWETHLYPHEIYRTNVGAYSKYSCDLAENKLFFLSYHCHSYHHSSNGKTEDQVNNREKLISFTFVSHPYVISNFSDNRILVDQKSADINDIKKQFTSEQTLIIKIKSLPKNR